MASSDESFRWVDKNDMAGVPIGEVTRGCSPDGRRVYIVRAYHDGDTSYAANYEEGNDYAEYETWGPQSSENWDYLMSKVELPGMIIKSLVNFY